MWAIRIGQPIYCKPFECERNEHPYIQGDLVMTNYHGEATKVGYITSTEKNREDDGELRVWYTAVFQSMPVGEFNGWVTVI